MAAFEAGRWAEALLGAAGESGSEAVEALSAIGAAFADSGRLAGFPAGEAGLPRLAATLTKAGADPALPGPNGYAARLALVMARRGRLSHIEAVVAAARAELDAKAGRLRVGVEAAVPLDDELRRRLVAVLARRTGAAAINLEESADPELLGGLRITIGWERIDGTLRRRLASLAGATGAARRGGDAW